MRPDVLIVGAGIAGASLAAEIAPWANVLLIEAEAHCGLHSTGRSAAFLSETYGGPLIQPLTTVSRSFLDGPPADFSGTSFLSPRGALHIADRGGESDLEAFATAFADKVRLEPVDRAGLVKILPGLREGWNRGYWEESCADIDVAALHGAYLKRASKLGVKLVTDARLDEAFHSGHWKVRTGDGRRFEAQVLVNAAGAWADSVASRCGERPLAIQPYRRTIAQLRVDPASSPQLPLVIDSSGRFYFKPEAGGRLWLSPHDETACEACDCAAEEEDVALAIARFEDVLDWRVERVERKWAGLRSFAPDRLPVLGYSSGQPAFFWFAGQGGFGIQTAPAAARIAASLLLDHEPDPLVAGIDPSPYSPVRFG